MITSQAGGAWSWSVVAKDNADRGILAAAAVIEIPPDPAFRECLVRVRGGLPDLGRTKMGSVRIWISYALDNCQVPAFIERL